MKVWKILGSVNVECYVKVSDEVFNKYDSSYKALQLARKEINHKLNGTQLLDVERGEQMENNIPVLEIKEV